MKTDQELILRNGETYGLELFEQTRPVCAMKTRIQAHEKVKPKSEGRKMQILDVLRRKGPLTNNEIADVMSKETGLRVTVQSVTDPIYKMRFMKTPLVEKDCERVCSVSGEKCVAWRAV